MPALEENDHIAALLEELADKMVPPAPPVVHVAAPTVNVSPPSIHVTPPGQEKTSWVFNIHRDEEGRISSVIANPT
jgi:hypothetical protein